MGTPWTGCQWGERVLYSWITAKDHFVCPCINAACGVSVTLFKWSDSLLLYEFNRVEMFWYSLWLKLFISVETFHVCSLLLLNTGCHPDTWTQNVLWTLNVYTWSHLQCRYVWTPDRKCFFLLSVQAGISMSASVCLLVTLSKWIHQICLICVLTLKLLAITSLELTSQKPRWKRVFCGHENLVLTPVWPRPRSDGCLLRSG